MNSNLLTNEWSVVAGNWADEQIIAFPYKSLIEYSDKSKILQNVVIDPKKIVGSDHPRYSGVSWRKFLSTGKRLSDNLRRFRQNPNYFGETLQPNSHYGHWSLAQIGENYYICEGNHRSIIAKYLAHETTMRTQIIPKVIQIVL